MSAGQNERPDGPDLARGTLFAHVCYTQIFFKNILYQTDLNLFTQQFLALYAVKIPLEENSLDILDLSHKSMAFKLALEATAFRTSFSIS